MACGMADLFRSRRGTRLKRRMPSCCRMRTVHASCILGPTLPKGRPVGPDAARQCTPGRSNGLSPSAYRLHPGANGRRRRGAARPYAVLGDHLDGQDPEVDGCKGFSRKLSRWESSQQTVRPTRGRQPGNTDLVHEGPERELKLLVGAVTGPREGREARSRSEALSIGTGSSRLCGRPTYYRAR